MTLSATSQCTDIDPEVHIYVKRAMGLRRAYYVNDTNKKLIDEILALYEDMDDPGAINEEGDKTKSREASSLPGVQAEARERR